MAAKLSDSELALRVRAGNRQRADRRRERLGQLGYGQLLVWIPTDLRNQIDGIATERGASISDTATVIIRMGIAALLSATLAPSIPTLAPVESLPLFDAARDTRRSQTASGPADERLARIRALKREQPELSNYAIADQVGCSEPTVRRALKKQTQEATG